MVTEDKRHELMRQIKHQFMTYRNGVIADTLRQAGLPYKVIFGLQLPQISQIANELKARLDKCELLELAWELWSDKGVRESRLLACRVMPPDMIDLSEVIRMCRDVQSVEEADILIFALVRHTQWMPEIRSALASYTTDPYNAQVIKAIDRFI